jgi:arylsulfatase A-like enzyme
MFNLFKKKESEKKLNVIIVTLDALRPDFVGNLPNLKKIIPNSSYFNNLTTYAPHSTGAFYAIFSGLYGCENGVNSYFGIEDFKEDKCKLLTKYFKERNYSTIGDSMNAIILPQQGFDKYLEQKESTNVEQVHSEIIDELNKLNKENKNFFVHFHISCIHYKLIHNVVKKYKFDNPEYYSQVDKNKQDFLKYALEADSQFGKISDKLQKYNLLENSILVVFSDHGASCGEKFGERYYSAFCYDITLKTFALFYNKEIFPAFSSIKLARTIDIMPTLLEALNIKEDTNFMKLTGKSLFPIIKSQEKESRIAFSETAPLEGTAPYSSPKDPIIHSIKNQNWKLIFTRPINKFELYNIQDDPNEKNDLFGKGYKEEKELMEILKKYTKID